MDIEASQSTNTTNSDKNKSDKSGPNSQRNSGLLSQYDDEEDDIHNNMNLNNIDHFNMNIDHTYEFNYGFLRDVLYEQMLHTQKKALHVSAKKYLETLISNDGYSEDLQKLVQKHIEYAQNLQNHVQFDNPNVLTRQQQRRSHMWRNNGPLIDINRL